MRLLFLFGFILVASAPNGNQAQAARQLNCPAQGAMKARVIAVNYRLELLLDDHRQIKLIGIEPPRPTPQQPDLDDDIKNQVRDWLKGKEILYANAALQRDRWGRIPAFVFLLLDQKQLPVNQALLESGLARYEPSDEALPCQQVFLEAEAGAREAALGVWNDPYYAVMQAGDQPDYAEKAGTFVIVEGQVSGVESNPFRTSLYLGPRRGRDVVVTVLRKYLKAMETLNLSGLAGSTLRVRGLLDLHYGAHIEISHPEDLEILSQKPDNAGVKSNSSTPHH